MVGNLREGTVKFKITDDKAAKIIRFAFRAVFEYAASDEFLGGSRDLVDDDIQVRHIELVYPGRIERRMAAQDQRFIVRFADFPVVVSLASNMAYDGNIVAPFQIVFEFKHDFGELIARQVGNGNIGIVLFCV